LFDLRKLHTKALQYVHQTRKEPTMSEEILSTIKQQIEENPIILYMKGSPQAPQCGFSAQTIQCMVACGQRFAYVDILTNPDIRANLPGYADWPTFPQLWVDGELVGGCDIITEMFETGELQTLLEETSSKHALA
jgi:monothiol glutaredoxin